MRLADFILQEMQLIVAQWEAFAATQLPAAASMKSLALRDHAQQILEAVAKDLETYQTRDAQTEKSMGRAPGAIGAPETAAQTHAVLRAQSGFSIIQLTAEYRALRASVLRLWIDACGPGGPNLNDLMRFNEAMDQAVAESVGLFCEKVDQSRNLLLGMLGHDMRSPLQTIQMTATYLSALNAGAMVSDAASRLINSGSRIKALLDDLLDFNRTKLGLGINIDPKDVDMAELFVSEIDSIRAAHATRTIEMQISGDTCGVWDGLRLQQLLTNLVLNAIKYGNSDSQINVTVIGSDSGLRVDVMNYGIPIDQTTFDRMFDPLQRGALQVRNANMDGSLGLGLYIAHEIAKGHGGKIEARSSGGDTVFSVLLPRRVATSTCTR